MQQLRCSSLGSAVMLLEQGAILQCCALHALQHPCY
jgi:hypothetical protein